MSEELTALEALKKIKKARYFVDFELDAKVSEDYKKELDIIETALKELIDIKSGKIRLSVNSGENYVAVPKYQYEQDSKKLKVLEIINKKGLSLLHKSLIISSKNYEEYRQEFQLAKSREFKNEYYYTQEEYDLLKEVLL